MSGAPAAGSEAPQSVGICILSHYPPHDLGAEGNTGDSQTEAKLWLKNNSAAEYGVYIVRSATCRRYYRFGMFANGLYNRLGKTYVGPVPGDRKDKNGKARPPNQTEKRRSWMPIWICTLDGGDKAFTKLAEVVLEIGIAKHFKLSDQVSEGSMFTPPNEKCFEEILPRIVNCFEIAIRKCALAVGRRVATDRP